jgi:predicted RNA-binding protein with PIN domain
VGVGATRPGRLPPAVFDDSAEAAEHLVRVPGTLIVVDGYNVSFAGWPELAITDQRRRLADAMAELSARAGSDIHVVFDGGEPHDQELGVRSGPREPVRVTFSPPGVDADEVIIDMAKSLVRRRPVLVATSDRRVRERVEAGGASVISAVQLLGAAGRQVRRMSREA